MPLSKGCPFCSRWGDDPHLRIVEFSYTYATLNPDQFFPGYCFVFTKEHVTELFHLTPAARHALIDEVNRLASALHRLFRADKMNYELIGNMAPHIHWHLIPRFTTDPLWPRPVWSEPHEPRHLTPGEYGERVTLIRRAVEEP